MAGAGRRSALKQEFSTLAGAVRNPTIENEAQVTSLETLFETEGIDVDVHGVVLFVHPEVEIEMRNPEVDVVHINELYDYVREFASEGTSISSDQRNRIITTLSLESASKKP